MLFQGQPWRLPDEGSCGLLASFAQNTADTMDARAVIEPEPPMLGPHFVRGESSEAVKAARHAASLSPGASVSSPDVIWHNGPILPATATAAIFWGKKWAKSSFVSDKITGLDSWYKGFGGSGYAATCDEYTGSSNGWWPRFARFWLTWGSFLDFPRMVGETFFQ
jgi:hypothetical protein